MSLISEKLAILGGSKTILKKFNPYISIGNEEIKAVNKVMRSGILSNFIGSKGKNFYGGKKVLEFEENLRSYFNVKYAITVNSWTSGLIAAIGAIGIEPGDEIIVSPWTMCASATSILHWNAIPVFADIDPETFCLDPKSVEKKISKNTKAILSIDIAGQSADMSELKTIADKYNIKIISDAAQAPGARYFEDFAGTLADVGGFSLNYHKHIHTGEGGVIVTNNNEIAEKLYLIRNHGEAVVEGNDTHHLKNILGHNFRMGEIEASIGIEQLKKLDEIILRRQKIAKKLNQHLGDLDGLQIPKVRENCTHVYYMYQMKVDIKKTGIKREVILKALEAEGVEGLSMNYANLHLLPMYQNKIAYGSKGFPWKFFENGKSISYKKGICPVAENLQDNQYLGYLMCMHELNDNEVNLLIKSFKKVWANLDKLRQFNLSNNDI